VSLDKSNGGYIGSTYYILNTPNISSMEIKSLLHRLVKKRWEVIEKELQRVFFSKN